MAQATFTMQQVNRLSIVQKLREGTIDLVREHDAHDDFSHLADPLAEEHRIHFLLQSG